MPREQFLFSPSAVGVFPYSPAKLDRIGETIDTSGCPQRYRLPEKDQCKLPIPFCQLFVRYNDRE
jgi:hypothetical protein